MIPNKPIRGPDASGSGEDGRRQGRRTRGFCCAKKTTRLISIGGKGLRLASSSSGSGSSRGRRFGRQFEEEDRRQRWRYGGREVGGGLDGRNLLLLSSLLLFGIFF
ncbi:hypothetical protein RJT34_06983 [Clitoria ternatea]|uniref:Uncharacterized protein n=1 Tax=Clitoria ternatea TaxID=43366 RepID=A0AAN9PS09_CLITE